ncbi:hypothetical protein E2C01_057155 [Portunus trituberculatus]|uniref:Uncharacterized protein n=1 Tax=Portunus trituberculatus TaxID=210409 RepID=A0A5B7GZ99_PORTR|nr:hypothetical protein [Portunus trituberculatus]
MDSYEHESAILVTYFIQSHHQYEERVKTFLNVIQSKLDVSNALRESGRSESGWRDSSGRRRRRSMMGQLLVVELSLWLRGGGCWNDSRLSIRFPTASILSLIQHSISSVL